MDDLEIEDLLTRVSLNDRNARAELKRILKKTGAEKDRHAATPGDRRRPVVTDRAVSAGNASVNADMVPYDRDAWEISNIHNLSANISSCGEYINAMAETTRQIREPFSQLNSAWEKLARESEKHSDAWVKLGKQMTEICSNGRTKAGTRESAQQGLKGGTGNPRKERG